MDLPFPPEVIHCPPGEPFDLSGPPLGVEETSGCNSALSYGLLAALGGAIFVLFLPSMYRTRGASRGATLVWREHRLEAEQAVRRQRAEAAGARPDAREAAPTSDTETTAPCPSAEATEPGRMEEPTTLARSGEPASPGRGAQPVTSGPSTESASPGRSSERGPRDAR